MEAYRDGCNPGAWCHVDNECHLAAARTKFGLHIFLFLALRQHSLCRHWSLSDTGAWDRNPIFWQFGPTYIPPSSSIVLRCCWPPAIWPRWLHLSGFSLYRLVLSRLEWIRLSRLPCKVWHGAFFSVCDYPRTVHQPSNILNKPLSSDTLAKPSDPRNYQPYYGCPDLIKLPLYSCAATPLYYHTRIKTEHPQYGHKDAPYHGPCLILS